ncbi:MAG: DNA-directed RNA polymerase subunit alpha C-terminal domain-containing protein [Cyanobacteria bacterium J06648_11]
MSESNFGDLNISDRAKENLTEAGVLTLAQLRQYDKNDLMSFRGIGAATAQEILDAITAHDEPKEAALSVVDEIVISSTPVDIVEEVMNQIDAATGGNKDDQTEQLTALLRWTMQAFEGMGRRTAGASISARVRQAVLVIRPELTPARLDDIKPHFPSI